jgi:hypothetical protein
MGARSSNSEANAPPVVSMRRSSTTVRLNDSNLTPPRVEIVGTIFHGWLLLCAFERVVPGAADATPKDSQPLHLISAPALPSPARGANPARDWLSCCLWHHAATRCAHRGRGRDPGVKALMFSAPRSSGVASNFGRFVTRRSSVRGLAPGGRTRSSVVSSRRTRVTGWGRDPVRSSHTVVSEDRPIAISRATVVVPGFKFPAQGVYGTKSVRCMRMVGPFYVHGTPSSSEWTGKGSSKPFRSRPCIPK